MGRAPAGDKVQEEGGGSGAPGTLLGSSTLRTGGSLCLVLTMIFGAARIAKRFTKGGGLAGAMGGGGPSPAGLLQVLGRYPVGRGQTLVLLRLDNRVLLLAQAGGGMRLRGGASSLTTLCEVTSPEDVASILMRTEDADRESAAAKFKGLLGGFEADHESGGVVEVGAGRRKRWGGGGDMTELWDERAGPAGGELRRNLESLRAAGVGGGR